MSKRPKISVYEPDDDGVEQLVLREMNAEEFEAHQRLVVEDPLVMPQEHPLLVQIKSMTDGERQQLRNLLG